MDGKSSTQTLKFTCQLKMSNSDLENFYSKPDYSKLSAECDSNSKSFFK